MSLQLRLGQALSKVEWIVNVNVLNSNLEFCQFLLEAKSSASTIGPTCAFDTKIYKNVCGFFTVNACGERNKKFFDFFHFCSQLPSLLVEKFRKNSK